VETVWEDIDGFSRAVRKETDILYPVPQQHMGPKAMEELIQPAQNNIFIIE